MKGHNMHYLSCEKKDLPASFPVLTSVHADLDDNIRFFCALFTLSYKETWSWKTWFQAQLYHS